MPLHLLCKSLSARGRLGRSPAPICIRRPIGWGALRQNIAVTFGTEKLEWCGYPMLKKIEDIFILF